MFSWLHKNFEASHVPLHPLARFSTSKQEVLPVCSFGVSRRFGSQSPCLHRGTQVPHPLTMTDPRWAGDVCSSLLWHPRYVIHKPFPVLLWSTASLNIQIKFWVGVQGGHNVCTHLCRFICSILPDSVCFDRLSPHHLPSDQSLWVLSLKIYNFSQKLLLCCVINVWNNFMRTF